MQNILNPKEKDIYKAQSVSVFSADRRQHSFSNRRQRLYFPLEIQYGGLIGIAQIASQMICGSVKLSGLFNTLMNIPLFILAWKALSKSFLFKTILSILIQSLCFLS